MEITDNKVTLSVTEIKFDTKLSVSLPFKESNYKKITDKQYAAMINEYIEGLLKKIGR